MSNQHKIQPKENFSVYRCQGPVHFVFNSQGEGMAQINADGLDDPIGVKVNGRTELTRNFDDDTYITIKNVGTPILMVEIK